MRTFFAMLVMTVLLVSAMVGTSLAHPLTTPGTERSIGGTSQGHYHGLECAANVSPVIGNLGLTCAADGKSKA